MKNQLCIIDFCENSIIQATPNQGLKRDNSVRSPQETDQLHKKLQMENEEQQNCDYKCHDKGQTKKVNMRINLQSKHLEKTISKFNQDLQKCMSDITKDVSKASSINDKVNELKAKVQELSTEKNTLAKVNQHHC